MATELLIAVKSVSNNNLFLVYLILMFIDMVVGKYRAMVTTNFRSDRGLNGLARHFTLLILIFGISIISFILDYNILGNGFMMFYILDYAVSIIENLTLSGVDFPDTITRYINTERKKYDDEDWGL